MSVKIRVTASKLTAPQKAIIAPRYPKSLFNGTEEPPNVSVESAHFFRSRHFPCVQRSEVELR
jgi:hypothetical protein